MIRKRLRRALPILTYFSGVGCASALGFLSPEPFTGWAPLAAGLIWAAYDLIDDGEGGGTRGNAAGPSRR